MKRTTFFLTLFFLLVIALPACKDSEYADWRILNEKWLAADKADTSFTETPSGLRYKIIYKGWELDRRPNSSSYVKVNYSGSLIDGTVFDKSSSAWIGLSSTIAGWREGLPKIHDGGSIILHVPSSLGYDTISTNPRIPPHSVLIFKIDLIQSEN